MSDNSKGDILVVDDADSIRQYLKVTLERAGYRVRLCSDASEACWEIEASQPDYIISDWKMPNMDGEELCQWVRSHHCPGYIYFILMTAHERAFDVVDGLDAGADDYLQKPIKINELLARLRCGERILNLQRKLKAPAESVTAVDMGGI